MKIKAQRVLIEVDNFEICHIHRPCTNYIFRLQEKKYCASNNNTLLINIRLNLQNGLWKTQEQVYVQQKEATTIQSSVENQSFNMAVKNYNASSAITFFFSLDDIFLLFISVLNK